MSKVERSEQGFKMKFRGDEIECLKNNLAITKKLKDRVTFCEKDDLKNDLEKCKYDYSLWVREFYQIGKKLNRKEKQELNQAIDDVCLIDFMTGVAIK